MAAIVNARDVLLQAAPSRYSNPANSAVFITTTKDSFNVTTGGVGSPLSIELNAQFIGITGTVTWGITGGTLSGISGNTALLTFANMSAGTATVTASVTVNGATFNAAAVITKTLDGSPGAAGASVFVGSVYKQQVGAPATPTGGTFNFNTQTLTPPAGWTAAQPATSTTPTWRCEYTFATNTPGSTVTAGAWSAPVQDAVNGSAGTNGNSVLTLEVYFQSASAPSAPAAGSGSYNFSTDTFTNTGMTSWSRALPASSTTPTYRSAFTFSTNTPATPVTGGTWSAPVVVAQNGATGAPGLNNAVVLAYIRSSTAPVTNPGAVTYDFAAAVITTGSLANGWSKTIPAGTDPLYTIAASASASTATDSIGAGEWATPVLTLQDGAKTATVTIFQRTNSATAPALPSATTTYTFASAALTGLNNGWATAAPTSTPALPFLHQSTATAIGTGLTDTIAAGEWAPVKVLSQNGASINNIIPDPTFRDLVWWNRAGYGVQDFTGSSTAWKMNYSLIMPANGGVLVDTSTEYFPMVPLATYRVEFQVYMSPDFAGSFSPFWHVPGNAYHAMGAPDTGADWGDGLPIAFNTGSPNKANVLTFTAYYTVPATGVSQRSQIRLKSQVTAGYVEFGSPSLVRMTDDSLITPGITLPNPVIVNPSMSAMTMSGLSDIVSVTVPNGQQNYDTQIAVASGGVAPYTYVWSISKGLGASLKISATSGSTVTISGSTTNNYVTGGFTVIATDANGRTVARTQEIEVQHGSGGIPP